MIHPRSWLCAAVLFAATGVRAADLVAGPMLGHVTGNSARVWMQFSEAGQLTINAFNVGSTQSISGVRVDIDGPSPFVVDVPVQNLQPDRSYRIEVKFDGQPVRMPAFTIRTAPVPGDEATFSVAFGSDLNISPPAPGAPLPVFTAINGTKPRAFFFLGNSGHLPDRLEDFPTTHRAAYRFITDFHSAVRRLPDLQQLLSGTPTYAVFSDHDFGPAGADGGYVFAQESLVAFQKFWPNPDWGTPQNPGCFTAVSLGDVDFFLLDARTFRDAGRALMPAASARAPETAPATGTAKPLAMLGAAQLEWLKKGLKASKASFKILAAPCTLWGDPPDHPDADSWSRFPAEQKAFLDWLAAAKINGVVAISGGHSAGEITRFKSDTLAYPVYTLASSSLCLPAGARPAAPEENPLRLGEPVSECTFGTLDFAGEHEHRFVTLRLRDERGKVRAEQTLLAVQLRN